MFHPPASPLSSTPIVMPFESFPGGRPGRSGNARSGAGITELIGGLPVATTFNSSAFARHGLALQGFARHGFARQGFARHGFARHGLARQGSAAISAARAGCGGQPQQSHPLAK